MSCAKRADKQNEGQSIPGGTTFRSMPSPIRRKRAKVEDAGKCVLSFRNPGHRLDLHGMHREEQGDPEASGHTEKKQTLPKQHSAQSMQKNIDGVVTNRPQPPKLTLDPKRGMCWRIILVNGAGFRPHLAQPLGAAQGYVLRHVVVIVPYKAGIESRLISQRRKEKKQGYVGRSRIRGSPGAWWNPA